MGFLQIIDFHTDQFEEFTRLENQWIADSAGARTSTGGRLYADRDNPGHYVALDWFTDYDSAMRNSDLPATSAFAEQAMAISTGEVVFHNLEPVLEVFIQGEPELREAMETNRLVSHAFTEDVVLDMIVPHGRVVTTGLDAMSAAMREETDARKLELWEAQPTPTGFVVEYAYRTLDEADSVAVGAIVATVREGKIARLFLTCGGNWDAETQRRVRESTGELAGSRA
jgi:quinol monooxygenase YgiN